MDHVLGRMSENSGRGVSFGTVRITTDLDFAEDAIMPAETTEDLAEALESLSEGAESLELQTP